MDIFVLQEDSVVTSCENNIPNPYIDLCEFDENIYEEIPECRRDKGFEKTDRNIKQKSGS